MPDKNATSQGHHGSDDDGSSFLMLHITTVISGGHFQTRNIG